MTPADLAHIVTEAAALAKELSALDEKRARLDELKEVLRTAAAGQDATFTGNNGEVATVKTVRDGIARTIGGERLDTGLRRAGEKVWKFFRLAPIPGKELPLRDLCVQVLSDLHKSKATALLTAITVVIPKFRLPGKREVRAKFEAHEDPLFFGHFAAIRLERFVVLLAAHAARGALP